MNEQKETLPVAELPALIGTPCGSHGKETKKPCQKPKVQPMRRYVNT